MGHPLYRRRSTNATAAYAAAALLAALIAVAGAAVPPYACDVSSPQTKTFKFCKTGLSIRERAKDVVERLSLDEKVAQLMNTAPAIPRLGIPAYEWWSEALHGLAYAGPGIFLNSTIHTATSFPQVILTAASFDSRLCSSHPKQCVSLKKTTTSTQMEPPLHRRRSANAAVAVLLMAVVVVAGAAAPPYACDRSNPQRKTFRFCNRKLSIRERARDVVGRLSLDEKVAQLVNTASAIPRLGIPAYEWWSEALHGVADVGYGIFLNSSIKAATSFPQVILTSASFDSRLWYKIGQVSPQDMADTYQPPFESCIRQARASGIMCAYNRVNGVPNCALIRYITSDCDAVSIIHDAQGYAKTPEDAVADVLKADSNHSGMDVDCGSYLQKYTKSAVQQRKVDQAQIDRALENLFAVRMRLGLFDGNPSKLVYGSVGPDQVCSRQHRYLALQAAQSGIVLLKNDAKLLPFPKGKTTSLAVIGPNADAANTLLGNYHGPPCVTISPLRALRSYVKNTRYHSGCDNVACSYASIQDAVRVAEGAEYVVMIMGLDLTQEREDHDRTDLVLPGQQQNLITAVAKAAKKPIVLVLLCGGPVDVTFAKSDPHIGAIIWAGYPGEAGGIALAQVIFGDHNPGGKLPMTWYPKEFVNVPMTDMRMRADPSSGYPGRTYKFYQGNKVFEFGHGLSYTSYSYEFIKVSHKELHLNVLGTVIQTADKFDSNKQRRYVVVSDSESEPCKAMKLTASVRASNKGEMKGTHPVLLFVRQENPSNGSPMKKLVGFESVELGAGETTQVEFEMRPCEHLTTANEDGVMAIKEGNHLLMVGDSQFPLNILLD
ncbi:hypothetical protein Cgig2_025844 [Carnegiea gigantea]|uniref:Fibronectin type III-like domain-containing protein n=1 Tax=Carnegiea gigantea TaxID=171969 RepID=A0A9Q1JSX5_9CARY|nr:hypothetical protein Cgig2_025844 [Carnegiea gigantea]